MFGSKNLWRNVSQQKHLAWKVLREWVWYWNVYRTRAPCHKCLDFTPENPKTWVCRVCRKKGEGEGSVRPSPNVTSTRDIKFCVSDLKLDSELAKFFINFLVSECLHFLKLSFITNKFANDRLRKYIMSKKVTIVMKFTTPHGYFSRFFFRIKKRNSHRLIYK